MINALWLVPLCIIMPFIRGWYLVRVYGGMFGIESMTQQEYDAEVRKLHTK